MADNAAANLDALSIALRAATARYAAPARRPTARPPIWARALNAIVRAFNPPPPAWDWRSQNVIGPARSQVPCNSCASFAIGAAIEALVRIRGHPPIAVDPGFIHTCLVHQGAVGDPTTDCQAPADLFTALTAIKARGYALDTGQYPFPAAACAAVADLQPIAGFGVLGVGALQSAIVRGGPVVTEMWVWENFFDYRGQTPTYIPDPTSPGSLGHVVCIVGFDATGWIIKNSYGPGWGRQGFATIRYGDCGIGAPPPPNQYACAAYSIALP
ncbi:C1 family peptidase [Phenylobacterium sp.]|jgi:hypothetical protein|uniref:C1 family peptidase n=1 Tax=Phenylobacterium sp. TaxID=1871053 RepID=UPI002E30C0CF|nr:C1 family peptidase [Phenylobacterium sp.]HEX3366052.1 C1 family peptidase [Phenylobacterium sp.]